MCAFALYFLYSFVEAHPRPCSLYSISRQTNLSRFRNAHFAPQSAELRPSASLKSLALWRRVYLARDPFASQCLPADPLPVPLPLPLPVAAVGGAEAAPGPAALAAIRAALVRSGVDLASLSAECKGLLGVTVQGGGEGVAPALVSALAAAGPASLDQPRSSQTLGSPPSRRSFNLPPSPSSGAAAVGRAPQLGSGPTTSIAFASTSNAKESGAAPVTAGDEETDPEGLEGEPVDLVDAS